MKMVSTPRFSGSVVLIMPLPKWSSTWHMHKYANWGSSSPLARHVKPWFLVTLDLESLQSFFAVLISFKGANQKSGWCHPGSLDRFKLLSNMQIRAAVTEIPFLVLAHLKYEITRRKWCEMTLGRCYWLCYCQNEQTICVCINIQIRRQLGKAKGKRKR